MGRRLHICIACKADFSASEEVELIEQVQYEFRGEIKRVVEKAICQIPNQGMKTLPDQCTLLDAVVENRTLPGNSLFIYGVSETGSSCSISISKTNYATQLIISLPFEQFSIVGKEKLQEFWIHIWDALIKFGVLIIAVGDELEFDDCPLVEEVNLFLDKFSLAYWVFLSTNIVSNLEENINFEAYNHLQISSDPVLFVSKNIEKRLNP